MDGLAQTYWIILFLSVGLAFIASVIITLVLYKTYFSSKKRGTVLHTLLIFLVPALFVIIIAFAFLGNYITLFINSLLLKMGI